MAGKIANTLILKRIINFLENQKEPVGITKISTEIEGCHWGNQKFKDGLLFLISLGVVEKFRSVNPERVFYKLSEEFNRKK